MARAAKTSVFGAKLRELRAARGWSQEILAGHAGLSQPCILYLESGQKQPSWDTAVKLARALEVSIEVFNEG